MSGSTGGRTLRDNMSLDEQLGKVAAELGAYYSLGYTPPTPGDDTYHSISVTVKRDDAQVRHRQGYRNSGGRDSARDGVVAAATLGYTQNPLGITLEAEAQERRPDGSFTVPAVVEIPIGNLALLPQTNLHTAGISMLSLVRDDRGGLSEIHDREYPIEIANNQLVSAITQDARFVLAMVLPAGRQRIAVSVQDTNSSLGRPRSSTLRSARSSTTSPGEARRSTGDRRDDPSAEPASDPLNPTPRPSPPVSYRR
jgi:hypothetical protein